MQSLCLCKIICKTALHSWNFIPYSLKILIPSTLKQRLWWHGHILHAVKIGTSPSPKFKSWDAVSGSVSATVATYAGWITKVWATYKADKLCRCLKVYVYWFLRKTHFICWTAELCFPGSNKLKYNWPPLFAHVSENNSDLRIPLYHFWELCWDALNHRSICERNGQSPFFCQDSSGLHSLQDQAEGEAMMGGCIHGAIFLL